MKQQYESAPLAAIASSFSPVATSTSTTEPGSVGIQLPDPRSVDGTAPAEYARIYVLNGRRSSSVGEETDFKEFDLSPGRHHSPKYGRPGPGRRRLPGRPRLRRLCRRVSAGGEYFVPRGVRAERRVRRFRRTGERGGCYARGDSVRAGCGQRHPRNRAPGDRVRRASIHTASSTRLYSIASAAPGRL